MLFLFTYFGMLFAGFWSSFCPRLPLKHCQKSAYVNNYWRKALATRLIHSYLPALDALSLRAQWAFLFPGRLGKVSKDEVMVLCIPSCETCPNEYFGPAEGAHSSLFPLYINLKAREWHIMLQRTRVFRTVTTKCSCWEVGEREYFCWFFSEMWSNSWIQLNNPLV